MSNDTNTIPFTLTNESISVVWDGKPYTVQKDTPQFHGLRKALLAALDSGDWSKVGFQLTMEGAIQQWLGDKFVVGEDQFTARDGTRRRHILYKGVKVPEQIVERIWRMASNNESPGPLFNFWERLQKNPSKRSVDSLFSFLQHEGIPIEADGTFLAYKGIRNDLKDQYTGTVDNSPGQVHEMARNLVSDDPRTACHYGFHVGAKRYADGHGPVTVICRVDPEHVVCVPYDSSAEKMRVCKYEVVGFSSGETMPSTTMTDDTKVTDEQFAPDEMASDDGSPGDGEDILDTNPSDLGAAVSEVEGTDLDEKQPINAAYFTRLKGPALMRESIDNLRKYASQTLKIVGASKLKGGKAKLVARIVKARKVRRK